ncbi:isopentenyl-diphosphate Delta-isomerase [Actinokineospora iranica]|uniref:isopentenyl-diphosphate Delta-isomerase n=1 Tax=Actinokineospora iranica TaxID=1271860 RepID=UPI000B89C231|nr:isopentenyl-diphosphate Delta-isomerase [Actinokineospora iranica]
MERVVLLDEAGNDVGVADKAGVHHADTPLHLAFSSYVFDRDGRFLLTRRATHKKTWPGVWTNSCCGHPAPGEAIADGVSRRLADELGLPGPHKVELVLPRFRYRAEMGNGVVENEMCPVYRVVVDSGAEPAPNPDEVDSAVWVPWGEFAESVLSGTREVSPWCVLQVRELSALGDDPVSWPLGDPADLPAAVVG